MLLAGTVTGWAATPIQSKWRRVRVRRPTGRHRFRTAEMWGSNPPGSTGRALRALAGGATLPLRRPLFERANPHMGCGAIAQLGERRHGMAKVRRFDPDWLHEWYAAASRRGRSPKSPRLPASDPHTM